MIGHDNFVYFWDEANRRFVARATNGGWITEKEIAEIVIDDGKTVWQ